MHYSTPGVYKPTDILTDLIMLSVYLVPVLKLGPVVLYILRIGLVDIVLTRSVLQLLKG